MHRNEKVQWKTLINVYSKLQVVNQVLVILMLIFINFPIFFVFNLHLKQKKKKKNMAWPSNLADI